MKKEKIKTILITSAITFFCTILLIAIVINVKNNSEVSSLKNTNEVKNKQFAVMLQNESGGYAESESSSWPTTGYELNTTLTNCTDETGTKVENVLRYENGNVAVKSNKKLYCYLYFDSLSGLCTSGSKLGSCLIEKNNKISSLDDTAYGGMYRYTGTDSIVNNNYVCFGTDDKEECLENSDKYMYRVIGVTSEENNTLGLAMGQVKLIKDTSIGTHVWHSSNTTDTKWESSTMYSYLQGSDVLGNTDIIASGWSNKISSVKWNIGDANTQTLTNAAMVYDYEDNTQTTGTSKIGLIYLSDYYYMYNSGGTQNCFDNSCTNWLTDTTNIIWTMTRFGTRSNNGYGAWGIRSNGSSADDALTYTRTVRPVFYLNEDEIFVSGMGTEEDPIMLRKTAGETLLSNPTTGLNTSTSYAGLYRYIGTTANNYVKLGDVLYRVIGITSEANSTLGLEQGQLKLVKAETIGTYQWHTDKTSNTLWENSAVGVYLQSEDIIGNENVISYDWSSKVDSVKWNIGDVGNYKSGNSAYDSEKSNVTTKDYKIGLIYYSDYLFSATTGGENGGCYNNSSCMNWLNNNSNQMFTMTRWGYYSGGYEIFVTYTNGGIGINGAHVSHYIYPVFYLSKDVYITNPEATGSMINPFILAY